MEIIEINFFIGHLKGQEKNIALMRCYGYKSSSIGIYY